MYWHMNSNSMMAMRAAYNNCREQQSELPNGNAEHWRGESCRKTSVHAATKLCTASHAMRQQLDHDDRGKPRKTTI